MRDALAQLADWLLFLVEKLARLLKHLLQVAPLLPKLGHKNRVEMVKLMTVGTVYDGSSKPNTAIKLLETEVSFRGPRLLLVRKWEALHHGAELLYHKRRRAAGRVGCLGYASILVKESRVSYHYKI